MGRSTPGRLFHWTCHHGAAGIERDGLVVPAASLPGFNEELVPEEFRWLSRLLWATDLRSVPDRRALGLTAIHTNCDRLTYCYELSSEFNRFAKWWPRWCADGIREERLPASARGLSFTPGALPTHWYVSRSPLPVLGRVA